MAQAVFTVKEQASSTSTAPILQLQEKHLEPVGCRALIVHDPEKLTKALEMAEQDIIGELVVWSFGGQRRLWPPDTCSVHGTKAVRASGDC